MVEPLPAARYVNFRSFDIGYSNGWDMPSAMHPQTILAYAYNDRPLMPDHGAPLRLYSPAKLGYKNTKYLLSVEFTATQARWLLGGPGVSVVRRLVTPDGCRGRVWGVGVWVAAALSAAVPQLAAQGIPFSQHGPGEARDALRVEVKPEAGGHMDALAFYFPVVAPDSAVLRLHWGEMVVPIRIRTTR